MVKSLFLWLESPCLFWLISLLEITSFISVAELMLNPFFV